MRILKKIFKSHSEKEVRRLTPILDAIDGLEEKYKALSDAELKAKTQQFRDRLATGETLDELLPEAFATVREAAGRVLGMRHYRVQMIGGIVLHQGRIAEMKTGEGKTLVATLPAYLNALTGEGVHIVTVNDYLAKRDSEWMGKLYRFLGLEVGLVIHGVSPLDRKRAYEADITYGTNNEFGFDYLRDNMVIYKERMVQRGHAFAIVDEVDSILIDEARTPLIISGMGDKSTDLYARADACVRGLRQNKLLETDSKLETDEYDGDYLVDEKARTVVLTSSGVEKVERFFGIENLNDPENQTIAHHVNQAMKAHGLMKLDVDYVVKDGEIIIVDEFTGRLMFGRRYSEGLHQAIEAKEKVEVQNENKTLATITFQNYFRLYKKLSGMTGTALTEEPEFREIYGLDVIEIPTNRPLARIDHPDVIYRNEPAKFRAVCEQIKEAHAKGQPVLVGTISIEKSELLSAMLRKMGVQHEVLNAKQHEREAQIVAQAGKKGAVTIATNMAGRGTDIMLGGNAEYLAKEEMRKLGYEDEQIAYATSYFETDDAEILEARAKFQELEAKHKDKIKKEAEEVRAAGGLLILGTERHESRRIDNQLRGRAGRQGDPGESRFYLSMEDNLMRLFGGDNMTRIVDSLKIPEDEPIDAKIMSSSIESAQKRVEGRNFDTRKHVLQYDDVMNKQREVIYGERLRVLNGENLRDSVVKMIEDCIAEKVQQYCAGDEPENWSFDALRREFLGLFLTEDDLRYETREQLEEVTRESIQKEMTAKAMEVYAAKEREYGEIMRELERVVMLQCVDRHWMDHIDDMDELRKGIGLRAYGQRDPVVEYKFESYDMFDNMIKAIREDTVKMIFAARVRTGEEVKRTEVAKPTSESGGTDEPQKKQPVKREATKVGRNDPCPCGSGLKYKKCCGK